MELVAARGLSTDCVNASLTEVIKVNDLGVVITLRFDIRNHCLRITGKALKTLGFIAKQYEALNRPCNR